MKSPRATRNRLPPYGRVVWTIPRMRAYARILGVPLEVSPWQADGMVTVKLAAP